MPNRNQERNFSELMKDGFEMSYSVLDQAIEWIRDNLNPEDVFEDSQLQAWAEKNFDKEEK